jgi:uncharacterized protein (TIGR03663 family)
MNRWAALALLLAVAGGLALRLPKLDARPLHNDEGVNAIKVAALWEHGAYKYDPHEFHGPTLYYASLPFLWTGSAKNSDDLDATRLRLVTVAFGIALILLLPLLADGLGSTATALAAIFAAVSPAMVFYSRYYIHEMLLVFFTLLTLTASWRYWRSRKMGWAVLAGAGLGLMFATKETFVLSIGAMLAAAAATFAWNRWWIRQSLPSDTSTSPCAYSALTFRACLAKVLPRQNIIAAVGVTVLVWLLLFSSFFSNWNGLVDSVGTYLPWLHRAGGSSIHNHGWYFYFSKLIWTHPAKGPIWSEAMILVLAIVGAAAAFCSNRTIVASPCLARFLAFYTSILAVIYSVISYKTTWCLLNFWVGMLLLAGLGGAALLQMRRSIIGRIVIGAGLLVGLYGLVVQSKLAAQDFAAERTNPYNYAQTSPNGLKLVERIEAIARVAPIGNDTVIKIIAPDSYGPLPWYLRRFKNTGWWEQLPEDPYAPMMIVSSKLNAHLDDQSNRAYVMTGMYELHPGSFVELYVELELWRKFVATLPKNQD